MTLMNNDHDDNYSTPEHSNTHLVTQTKEIHLKSDVLVFVSVAARNILLVVGERMCCLFSEIGHKMIHIFSE